MSYSQQARNPNPGKVIELYRLDATNLKDSNGNPGPVLYWTPGPINNASVVFGGVTYTALPIKASGFEWNTKGTLPQPKLTISNLENGLQGYATQLVIAYGDLVAATVTRIKTFDCFLDTSPLADPTASNEADVFVINRKSAHTKTSIEFELAAIIDQQGRQLPGRQVLRDACSRIYRTYASTGFVAGNCPYTGSAYFDEYGNSVSSPADDVCGKRLGDCLLRFGQNTPLPTWAFPGVAQTQV